jgi:hypothetical protein
MIDKMNENKNAINCFEIPVLKIERAKKYYESILDVSVHSMEMDGIKMSVFPTNAQDGNLGGGIAASPMHKPGKEGTIVYLNCNPDLQLVLDRIEKFEGKITMQKTPIEPNGFMAFMEEKEGNIGGIYSTK